MSDLVIGAPGQALGTLANAVAEAVAGTARRLGERIAARGAASELSRLDDRALKDVGLCRADLAAVGAGYGPRAATFGRVREAPREAPAG